MDKVTTTSDTASRQLIVSRVVNAPRELVWEVWTKPEHIKNWWGPNGFTNTISKMDVRPGGEWEFIMHGPDGTDYPNKNFFKELHYPEKIVLVHGSEPVFEMIATFTAQGNKTLIEVRSVFESEEVLKKLKEEHIVDEGLKQNVDKLEKYLENLQSK